MDSALSIATIWGNSRVRQDWKTVRRYLIVMLPAAGVTLAVLVPLPLSVTLRFVGFGALVGLLFLPRWVIPNYIGVGLTFVALPILAASSARDLPIILSHPWLPPAWFLISMAITGLVPRAIRDVSRKLRQRRMARSIAAINSPPAL